MQPRNHILEETLKGKSVLFIGVQFYEYYLAIQDKLEQYGAKVSFFAERDTSILYGFVNRLFSQWLSAYQTKYYNYLLNKIRDKEYDYLLVVRGHGMPLSFVQKIKKLNPEIVCIMYQWDANINSPYLKLEGEYNIIAEFDRVLSFDYKDVEENPWIKYSPTFYIDEIKELDSRAKSKDKEYDFFFFGSYLPERYNGLLKFQDFVTENGYTMYTHFYMPYRYYFIERLKGTKIDRNLIKNKPMQREEYLNLLSNSKTIVDVSNAKQTGMAMRVIDAIGCGKKVLTTNKWVTKERSYNPAQIAIIDLDNIVVRPGFFEEKIIASETDYTIDNWLNNMFCKQD